MDTRQSLRVVLFESANLDFYLLHFDLTGKIRKHHDTAVDCLPASRSSWIHSSISPSPRVVKHREEIRGCVRGVSSEFVLACDMRFARQAREHDDRGPTRSRRGTTSRRRRCGTPAAFGGSRARARNRSRRGGFRRLHLRRRYGYAQPGASGRAELDGFVDALARRIASFNRRAIAAAKNLVNQVSLPSADELLDAITSFETALTWPEAQRRIQALLERGLQRDADFEKAWPEVLGTLLDTEISSQSSLQKKGTTR